MNQPKKQKSLNLQATPESLKGVYSNNMQLQHTANEFVMDFIMLYGNHATLNARIITSPRHMKAVSIVISNAVKKYEETFGEIEAEKPSNVNIVPQAQA